jgi:threonine 3-dehydrogenase
VTAASICGTDTLIDEWGPWAEGRLKTPRIIGHEFAGEVAMVGREVAGVEAGQRVSAESHFFCGSCYQCRTGNQEVCRDVRIMGVDADGSFAQFVKVPASNIWPNHPDIPDHIASIQEPLGNATLSLPKTLLARACWITGVGPIGLMRGCRAGMRRPA